MKLNKQLKANIFYFFMFLMISILSTYLNRKEIEITFKFVLMSAVGGIILGIINKYKYYLDN